MCAGITYLPIYGVFDGRQILNHKRDISDALFLFEYRWTKSAWRYRDLRLMYANCGRFVFRLDDDGLRHNRTRRTPIRAILISVSHNTRAIVSLALSRPIMVSFPQTEKYQVPILSSVASLYSVSRNISIYDWTST